MKKIVFQSDRPDVDIEAPRQASKTLPQWFRVFDRVVNGKRTVKSCMPFLDASTAGYTLVLPVDVFINANRGDIRVSASIDVVAKHYKEQIPPGMITDTYSDEPYKWINSFYIKTPKGYSSYIMHPANRVDLPFVTLSGVVDTDRHPLLINLPFLIKENFSGVIPAGTPIAQILPFKREEWRHNVIDDVEPKRFDKIYEVDSPPFDWYKRKIWSKKGF